MSTGKTCVGRTGVGEWAGLTASARNAGQWDLSFLMEEKLERVQDVCGPCRVQCRAW
jgi:hypothetical protein